MKACDLYLALISASAMLTAGACRLIAALVQRRNWKSSRGLSVLFATCFVFDFWNDTAQRMSGFHPNKYLVWASFAGWVLAVAVMIAWGTGVTREEFLWGAPPREAKFISLGLTQPNDPRR